MMQERRRFVRLATRLTVAYRRLPSTDPHEAVIRQIGVAGACLVLQQMARPGSLLQVDIPLPELTRPLRVTGKVIWCEPHETIGQSNREVIVEVGIHFVQSDQHDVAAIANFMASILQSSPPA